MLYNPLPKAPIKKLMINQVNKQYETEPTNALHEPPPLENTPNRWGNQYEKLLNQTQKLKRVNNYLDY